MKDKNSTTVNKDRQIAALLAALSMIGFALGYWAMQIQDVLETLAMAYG